MDTWLNAVAICGAAGFVLALLHAAFLPRVTRQFSLQSLDLGSDARISDVIAKLEDHRKKKPSIETFRGNLKDPGFWLIFAGLWALFGTLCLLIWAIVHWLAT